jgi:uncharacterized protein YdaU (DUF1376 family)
LPTDKLLAEWFWVADWHGSSAFGLPIEVRGLYREMLTRAWRNGAFLPNDPLQIQRTIGATPDEWDRCWPKVAKYWRVDGDRLVNDKQLEVYAKALYGATRRSEVARMGAAARHGAPADDKPDKPRQTIPGEKSWKFSNLYISPKMHKVVLDALGKRSASVDFDSFYNGAALAYLEGGQPADLLGDLKRRAAASARSSSEVGPPSVEETAAREARMIAEHKPLTAEEKARVKAMFRGSR